MNGGPYAVEPPPLRDHIGLLAELGIEFNPNLKPPRKKRGDGKQSGPGLADGGNVIAMGSRNNTLASVAGGMRRRGASEDVILAGLRKINGTLVAPPLDDGEVVSIAQSVARYAPSQLATGQTFTLTDTGNAQRLVARHGDSLRYVFDHKSWLIWDGTRWAYDNAGMIVELAKNTARSIYHEAAATPDPDLGKALGRHATKSLNAPRINAMVELARSDPRNVVQSSDLDCHDEVLGVANGVIDLRTGKLRHPRQDELIARHAPVAFDPTAKCVEWHRFLNRVTKNSRRESPTVRRTVRRHLVDYLRRVMGYTLSGRTDEQVLFFLFGFGANGKTTFLKIVEELLGPELACQLPYDSLVARKQPRSATNDIARLQGRRAVFTNEVEDGTFLAESLIKQLTGTDTIEARFMYKEFVDFEPKFKLFIAGNHKPIIKGVDLGIWRRFHLVPFEVTIPEGARDPRLLDKLREELPGILNWALRGYRLWRKQRLSPPRCVTDAVKEYRDEMDILGQWVKENCTEGSDKTLPAHEAYDSYKLWAMHNGYRPMTMAAFGRKLVERYPRKKTARGNLYEGVELDSQRWRGGYGGFTPNSGNPP